MRSGIVALFARPVRDCVRGTSATRRMRPADQVARRRVPIEARVHPIAHRMRRTSHQEGRVSCFSATK